MIMHHQDKKRMRATFDSFLGFNFIYDKRNQKFDTTDGFFSNYSLVLPLIVKQEL